MRPLWLVLDGFGSYRRETDVDFSDVRFFALTGPTGAGKTTVLDGICFALYGAAPRWSGQDPTTQALAPGAGSCLVTLAFEADGKSYYVARALARDTEGAHTSKAQLRLLKPEVSASAPFSELLARASPLAEGPEQVTSAVGEILGLSYEDFIRSVLPPRGRFADFLRAEPGRRHELLAELLAYAVYGKVGELARQRADRAAERLHTAQHERTGLAGVTEEAEERASERAASLTSAADVVDCRVKDIIRVTDQARQREQQAEETRAQVSLLAGIAVPADIPGLARQIARADRALAARRQQAGNAELAADEAERVCENLPDRGAVESFGRLYAKRRDLSAQLQQQQWYLTAKLSVEKARASALETMRDGVEQVRAARDAAAQRNAAYPVAEQLLPGDLCPVCMQLVTEVPHHPVPPGIREARAVTEAAERSLEASRKAHADAVIDTAVARIKVEATLAQLADIAVALGRAPDEAEVADVLARAAEAEGRLREAREDARAQRNALRAAESDRAALAEPEWAAWNDLRRARDSVAGLDAPAVADRELGTAWSALADWAQAQHAERAKHLDWLEREAADQHRILDELTGTVRQLLAGQGMEAADVLEAPAAVAAERARAVSEYVVIARQRERADQLDDQIIASREESQVAGDLAKLLGSASFQRWLSGEALDSLVAEASLRLMEMSGGRYQLDLDDRHDLVVIDYQDAGARRPAHSLSGGETFQASLALALALSRQVAGLSAETGDGQPVFLDEGFGALDDETLETVLATLRRLADSGRMVGLVTSVPALAGRVPVRFVVSRAGAGSSLRRERA
jgi:DNA repair protein SbcC/Rad50